MTGKRPPGRGRQSRWRNERLAELEDILNEHSETLTLIVGNGVNLSNQDAGNETWKALLERIGRERGFLDPGQGLHETRSLVELSDLMQLHADDADKADDDDGSKESVQSEFCNRLENWTHGPGHECITNWARKHDVPVLTTNFDETLSDACGAELVHAKRDTSGARFSRYYPWSSRFEVRDQPIKRPRNSFAIWHVNGMRKYVDSVRLGLSHYMGSVQQARTWLHRGDDRLFADEKAIDRWKGRNTWLDAFFANDLLIFGLGLGRDEVFLRWLLIERARYCQEFGIQDRDGWYVRVEGENDPDRDFLLEHVGVQIVEVASHGEIYSPKVWNA